MPSPAERLRALDSCAVSDALDKVGLSGAVSGLRQLSSPRRIAGRVMTCKLVASGTASATGGAPRHLGTTAIERADAGDVIVVEQRTGLDAAGWGGILSLAAKRRSIAGVVCDGPVRDVDEAREHDFPIYARSATPRTARGRIAEAATGEPVRIGEIEVRAGDYVIADASGVVFVPSSDLERALDTAEAIARRESAMARTLKAGKAVTQVMGADYEHLLHS
jgi:regulator of RNase E activity RraA